MFGAQQLILLGIASFATAAVYRPHGTAPYSNTTVQASYPFAPLASSEPSISSLIISESSTLSPPSYASSNASTTSPPSSSTRKSPSKTPPDAVSTPLTEASRTSQLRPYHVHGSGVVSGGYGLPHPTGNQASYPVNGSGPITITNSFGYPRPTGSTRPLWSFNSTSNSTFSTALNTLCTVNIPSANIEWWYGATYYSAVGRFTAYAPNWTNYLGEYLTMVPNTQTGPFDVSSAIASEIAWSQHVTYDSEYDMTWTDYILYTVTPAAATTSIVERDYRPALPSGNVILATDILDYLQASSIDATVPIATAANTTSAVTSATPFAYFTAYEVEDKTNGTTITQTINLPQPTALEYAIEGIESSSSASGTVPTDFLQHIPQSACVPGAIKGSVTVLVVVDLLYLYLPHVNPFIVHIESSVTGWDDNPVIVAQATSIGQPSTTTDSNSEPTQAGNGASDIPFGGSQSGANPSSGGGGQSDSDGAAPVKETVGSIGTNPVVVEPSSVIIVGSQTIQPGAPGVTIGGSSISVDPSATAIVVDGHTSALPIVANPGSPSQVVGTVGGSPVVIGPSSAVIVGTQALQAGGNVVIVNGDPVSLVPSGNAIIVGSTTSNGAIVGTKTSYLPQVIFPTGSTQAQAGPPPPVLSIGSLTLTANAATHFSIAPGETLTPGGTATVNGQWVSLDPSAAFVVVGASTQVLPTSPAGATARPEIVVGGATITALPNSNALKQVDAVGGASGPTFVVSGQTLSPGHQITVDGNTISLAPSGSFVVINGVTSTISAAAAHVTPPPLTIDGDVFSPLSGPGTSYSIDGQLLTAGGTITVDGTTIFLAPGATALVVNGVTTTLASQAIITNPPLLTIGLHTYTAGSGGGTSFIIDGQTLTLGGTITVNGTTISLAPGATELIYGSAGHSTTSELFPATTTTNPSLTNAASWPANAGATGQAGQAAPTSSKKGAAHSLIPSMILSLTSFVAGVLLF